MIDDLFGFVPTQLLDESGSVFYSGRDAFSNPSPLYVLGLNPGGSPVDQARETQSWHSNRVLNEEPSNWSAYRDESWQGASPGTRGMQPRVLHLLRRLGCNAGGVLRFAPERRHDVSHDCARRVRNLRSAALRHGISLLLAIQRKVLALRYNRPVFARRRALSDPIVGLAA